MKSESSSSSKITDIVRLQQILKKWKKLAINRRSSSEAPTVTAAAAKTAAGKFLKKTLSLSENAVPKGSVAVCVGEELRRFVIPMEYLGHHSFAHLLREAEEEFGFQQEGVLKFPCQVSVFENTLKAITQCLPDYCDYPPMPDPQHHHPQMCR